MQICLLGVSKIEEYVEKLKIRCKEIRLKGIS